MATVATDLLEDEEQQEELDFFLGEEDVNEEAQAPPSGPGIPEKMQEAGEDLSSDDIQLLMSNLEKADMDTAEVRSGLSDELQEAIRIAEGTEGEVGKFTASSVGFSALQHLPYIAEFALGQGKLARQRRGELEAMDPQGLSEAQEQAFAEQEAGVGARAREGRLRQQALEASKGGQVSARDLQRSRDAMRKELQEGATKVGVTKTITDITLENQQEQQRQKDLDSLAQFQTQYFRNLIGTPLAETVGSIGELYAKRAAFREAPDVASSVEKLQDLGVSQDDIAGMLYLALEKSPAERKKYLADISTKYEDLASEGEARARSAVRPAERSPGEEAQSEQTATVPAGQPWQLPRNGDSVYGPFELEGDETYNYYWDNGSKRYIAYAKGQQDMIPIRQDNMEANNKLKPAFDQWQNMQAQQ